jgi:hypothetical protein
MNGSKTAKLKEMFGKYDVKSKLCNRCNNAKSARIYEKYGCSRSNN